WVSLVAPLGEGHGAGVVPAVDDFGDAAHAGTGLERRVVGDVVDVGLMDFEVLREVGILCFGLYPVLSTPYSWLGEQFVVAGNGFHFPGLFALPDWKRGAPEAFAREGPIDIGRQEVAHAAFLDVVGEPVDVPVVVEHLLLVIAGANEPAFARILNERVFFGAPAERIFVAIFFAMKEQAAMVQIADDVFVAVFDPAAAAVVGSFVGKGAVGCDGVDEFREGKARNIHLDVSPAVVGFDRLESALLGRQNVEVYFAECRCLVDYS